jgi:hypothetical protein
LTRRHLPPTDTEVTISSQASVAAATDDNDDAPGNRSRSRSLSDGANRDEATDNGPGSSVMIGNGEQVGEHDEGDEIQSTSLSRPLPETSDDDEDDGDDPTVSSTDAPSSTTVNNINSSVQRGPGTPSRPSGRVTTPEPPAPLPVLRGRGAQRAEERAPPRADALNAITEESMKTNFPLGSAKPSVQVQIRKPRHTDKNGDDSKAHNLPPRSGMTFTSLSCTSHNAHVVLPVAMNRW